MLRNHLVVRNEVAIRVLSIANIKRSGVGAGGQQTIMYVNAKFRLDLDDEVYSRLCYGISTGIKRLGI